MFYGKQKFLGEDESTGDGHCLGCLDWKGGRVRIVTLYKVEVAQNRRPHSHK